MTIDKFGRHIHKHIIKKHLMDEDVLTDFLKHPKIKKVLEVRAENIPAKYVIQIFSDGTISSASNAYMQSKSKSTIIYVNKLYEGKIVNVQYSHKSLTSLLIDGEEFDSTKPRVLKKGAKFILKYIGPKPVPKHVVPVYVEVVVEGNVIS